MGNNRDGYKSFYEANSFIRSLIGIMSTGLSCETLIMLRHTKDIIQKHHFSFNNAWPRLNFQKESTKEIYKNVVTQLFHDGFKWG